MSFIKYYPKILIGKKFVHVDDIEDVRVKLVSDEFESKLFNLKDRIIEILQNNHPWAFFLVFGRGKHLQLKAVNLTKTFPIRISHYDNILQHVTHELDPQFENKLGWKIAELYGRVGTSDYEEEQLSLLIENIHLNLEDSFKDFLIVKDNDFKKMRANLEIYRKNNKKYIDDMNKLYSGKTL